MTILYPGRTKKQGVSNLDIHLSILKTQKILHFWEVLEQSEWKV